MKIFYLGAHASLHTALLFMVIIAGKSLRFAPHHYTSVSSPGRSQYEGFNVHSHHIHAKQGGNEEGIELDTGGSSLPDCSHACGPCLPCKRVMVTFKCSIAESCPVVYRCMCNGKYYHVPSN